MPVDAMELPPSAREERPEIVAVEPVAPAPEIEQRPAVEVFLADRTVRVALFGTFLILLTAALYFAADFMLPVTLAFLLALVLSPVVRALHRRGIPEALTAIGLVLTICAMLGAGIYFLSGPVSTWVGEAPNIANQVRTKIAAFRKPVEAIAKASSQVQELTDGPSDGVQKVVVSEPGLLSRAATGLPEVVAKATLTLILLLFLLSSGDMFYRKIVAVLPTLSDKKKAVRILRDVERVVSRYLLTILVINAGLGTAIALESLLIGMPTPLIWGIAAGLLNFIPYVGPLIGIILVSVVGIISFDTVSQAAVAPALYLATAILEGQIVTPMVVGRRLELNEVAIFIAIAFWGWLWGIVGALLAVPLLIVFKVFADHAEGLQSFGEFLSARHIPDVE